MRSRSNEGGGGIDSLEFRVSNSTVIPNFRSTVADGTGVCHTLRTSNPREARVSRGVRGSVTADPSSV